MTYSTQQRLAKVVEGIVLGEGDQGVNLLYSTQLRSVKIVEGIV